MGKFSKNFKNFVIPSDNNESITVLFVHRAIIHKNKACTLGRQHNVDGVF